jgi:hypothetical protein
VQLLEAFESRNEKLFDQYLLIGANPEQTVDRKSNLSTFELLCCKSDASYYILKCLAYKTDPNRVSKSSIDFFWS